MLTLSIFVDLFLEFGASQSCTDIDDSGQALDIEEVSGHFGLEVLGETLKGGVFDFFSLGFFLFGFLEGNFLWMRKLIRSYNVLLGEELVLFLLKGGGFFGEPGNFSF
jgi:hypothetical protein